VLIIVISTCRSACVGSALIETVTSHRRALYFLYVHYSDCDVLTDEFGLHRIEFHILRLLTVVPAPEGNENEAERICIAIVFFLAFWELEHFSEHTGLYPISKSTEPSGPLKSRTIQL